MIVCGLMGAKLFASRTPCQASGFSGARRAKARIVTLTLSHVTRDVDRWHLGHRLNHCDWRWRVLQHASRQKRRSEDWEQVAHRPKLPVWPRPCKVAASRLRD